MELTQPPPHMPVLACSHCEYPTDDKDMMLTINRMILFIIIYYAAELNLFYDRQGFCNL